MPPPEVVAARPRSTVEILDDAWRLSFADLPLLLALCALFGLPALTCLLVLLCMPAPEWGLARFWLPALTALLLLLAGLSSGACQEAFHSWAEGYPIRFGECVKAAAQRAQHHVSSQALAVASPLTLLVGLLAPALPAGLRIALVVSVLPLWFCSGVFGLARQPAFPAGQQRFWRAVKYGFRAGTQHFGQACLLQLARGLMFVFAVLNVHLFWNFALWTAENLGGFDAALLDVLCSLGNPVYLAALLGGTAWLLGPFNEAVAYFFFVDARTRYEGLDLWQRVEELFPVQSKTGALVLALVVGLATAGAAGADEPLPAVRAAQLEIAAVRDEIQAAQPYPGGQKWLPRLQAVHDRLEASQPKPGGYRWFQQAIESFPKRTQTQALALLDDLEGRLKLVEDSLTRRRKVAAGAEPSKEDIKGLLPPDPRSGDNKTRPKAEQPEQDKKAKIEDDKAGNQVGPGGGLGGGPVGPGLMGPTSLGGLAYPLLVLLVGLAAAVLLAGLAYGIYRWWIERVQRAPASKGALAEQPEAILESPDQQNVRQLWRQADDRARAGDYLGAVRTLYLAVLALLHQGGLIRYERTRTNGEYADQLRPRSLLHRPFLGLTGVFELKWYGERACQAEDYARCRQWAEEIRAGGEPGA